MRISRKKRPKKTLIPHFKINTRITATEVRLIDENSENIGVFSIEEALQKATDADLDLVEINPKAQPPVVQIKDFKHFKYQKEKEIRKQKAKTHISDIKGIRLSMRIGIGDMQTRQKQALKFLERGDKVKMEIILRGAERYKTPIAYDVIKKFFALVNEGIPIKYEQHATRQGNKITAIIIKQ
jgi:translation initiation factor IF-3